MTLSPFEVERREFGRATRGYKVAEVDSFMDEVRASLTELWQERGELRDQVELLTERVARFQSLEEQLKNTLLLAQESAEKATEQARREAELVLREAGQKAREIVHTAHEERQSLEGALRDMRSAEQESRQRFRSLAQTVLHHLDETEEASPAAAGNLRAAVRAQTTASMPAVVVRDEPAADLPAQAAAVASEAFAHVADAIAPRVQQTAGTEHPVAAEMFLGEDRRTPQERAQERARRMAARAARGTEEISELAASMEKQADIATAPIMQPARHDG